MDVSARTAGYVRVAELRVLAWPKNRGSDENPYTSLLYSFVESSRVEVIEYSPRVAWRGQFDIFHLHWPDWTIGRKSSWRGAVSLLHFIALTLALKARGKRIVRTVHNTTPHGGASLTLQRSLYWWLRKSVDLEIHLTSASAGQNIRTNRPPRVVIPHGLLIDPSAFPNRIDARRHLTIADNLFCIAFFGGIDHYKGVLEMVAAFESWTSTNATLIVAGRCSSADLRTALIEAGLRDHRISFRDGFVDEFELLNIVAASDLVALPYTRVHNSGSAFVALAGGRRVLLPRTATFEDLQRQVGSDSILLFDGPLAVEHLELAAVKGIDPSPNLDGFSWPVIAELTTAAYDYVAKR